jgi:hypothetical protein
MAHRKRSTYSDEIYRVTQGPLKGGIASIIEEDGDRVLAIVSGNDWLTPPVYLKRNDLEKVRSVLSLFPMWERLLFISLVVVAIACAAWMMISSSRWAPLAVLTLCAVAAFCPYAWYRARNRKLKTCPVCTRRLDPDIWSHCDNCGWDRPMPDFMLRSTDSVLPDRPTA